jgi:hypothetical protein
VGFRASLVPCAAGSIFVWRIAGGAVPEETRSNCGNEHAVLLHIDLGDDEYGSEPQRETVFALEDELEQAIAAAGAGELDGNEFGGGEVVLYMYGPDKDRLWAAIEPVIRGFPMRPAFALVRAGGPDVAPQQIHL